MAKVFGYQIIFVVAFLSGCASHGPSAEVVSINGEIQPDSSLYADIQPYQSAMESKMNKVIGYAEVDLTKEKPEGKLGNFIADLALYTALQSSFLDLPQENTFCLLNHGGLRAPFSQGEITVGNVYEVMPFDNEIVDVYLPAEKVIELATYIAHTGGHPMSGIEIIAEQKDEKFELEIFINGKALDKEQNYHVITSDYLANGGDHMDFFQDPLSMKKSGILLRDAILEYIEKLSSKVSAKIEGRLKIKTDE